MNYSEEWFKKFKLHLFETIDSTNSEAKRYCFTNLAEYDVICSKMQNAGRGRFGKSWVSPEGNFYCSIIVPKTSIMDKMSQLSFVTALSIEHILESIFTKNNIHKKINLKWPNDVLVGNKKISGILLENGGKNNEYVIIGVGVNLLTSPNLIENKTTSLKSEGVNFLKFEEFLDLFMISFHKFYNIWLESGFFTIRENWMLKAKSIGEIIHVNTGYHKISGKFIDIDLNGAMRLLLDDESIEIINNGEVYFEK